LEKRIGDKFLVAFRHNDTPQVVLLDTKRDRVFELEGAEVQALRDVLASVDTYLKPEGVIYPDGGGMTE
jgi:hypothetical protein